jgi:hypothetical protein
MIDSIKNKNVKIIKPFFTLLIVCSATGCQNNNIPEAHKTVNAFYNHYKPGDYRVVDKTKISQDLIDKIDKATFKQTAEAQKLKALGSTDKPPMIEGDIYTSLYEGATKHEIIKSTAADNMIKSEVKFMNEYYNNQTWTDTVVLIRENGNWKIDNILYRRNQGGAKSTKEVLDVFLNID